MSKNSYKNNLLIFIKKIFDKLSTSSIDKQIQERSEAAILRARADSWVGKNSK